MINNIIDFVANIDYSTYALKAIVKVVEVGIDVVLWSLGGNI